METSKIMKQVDHLKQIWANRLSRGIKARVYVLYAYNASQGDIQFAQVNTRDLEANGEDPAPWLETTMDGLLRDNSVARITVHMMNMNGRNAETFVIQLRAEYADAPMNSDIEALSIRKPKEKIEPAEVVAPQPKQGLTLGLGDILAIMTGNMGGLGGVDESTQQQIQGIQALMDFRDRRRDESQHLRTMERENADMRAKQLELERKQEELERKLKAAEEALAAKERAAEESSTRLNGVIADLKTENEELRPKNNMLGMAFSEMASNVLSGVVTRLAHRHAPGISKLMGLSTEQFLGMLEETDEESEPTPRPTMTETPDDVEVEEVTASAPAPSDATEQFGSDLAQWLRQADPEEARKMQEVIREMAQKREVLNDLHKMSIVEE